MQPDHPLIQDINDCRPGLGEAALWWIGQHSFIVKLGETVCYLDPFLSDFPGRQVPPPLHPSKVTNANLVLGTHDHLDHIDHDALPHVLHASPTATLIIPQLFRQKLVDELKIDPQRVRGIDVDAPIAVGNLTINAVPAAHEFLDVDPGTGLHPYLGFVIASDDFCLYHAGDTCIYEGMQSILRRWQIDLALLPINGRDAQRLRSNIVGNMTYQEAADLAGAVGFSTTIPAHFEMFKSNSVDPQLFLDYMHVKYPKLHTFIPQHGKRTIIRRQRRSVPAALRR